MWAVFSGFVVDQFALLWWQVICIRFRKSVQVMYYMSMTYENRFNVNNDPLVVLSSV